MILSKLRAAMAGAAMTLVSYSSVWAQATECGEFDDRLECSSGGTDGGTVGGGGTPELDGPGILILITIGIAAAFAIARRK